MSSEVSTVLGSPRRTQILILIALLGETYPTEIARLLEAPLYSVQRVVNAFDREGILATRISGNSRRVSLDPRYYAGEELRRFLLRLADGYPDLKKIAARRRSRPRRAGKLG
jgi:hypothetical protein